MPIRCSMLSARDSSPRCVDKGADGAAVAASHKDRSTRSCCPHDRPGIALPPAAGWRRLIADDPASRLSPTSVPATDTDSNKIH